MLINFTSAYEIPSANTTESRASHQATNFNFAHSKKFSLHTTRDLSNKCSVCPNVLGQGISPYTSSQFIDAATSSNNTGKFHSLNDTANTSYHIQAMGSQFWPEQVESKPNPYAQSPAPFCGNRSPILSLQNCSEDPFSRDLYSITRYLNEGHSERYALLDQLECWREVWA